MFDLPFFFLSHLCFSFLSQKIYFLCININFVRNIRKKFDNLFSLLPSPFKSSLPNQTTGQPYIYFSLDTFDLTCILIEIIPCCAPVKPEKIVANSGKILLKFVREWVRNLTALILQYWAKREMKTVWFLFHKFKKLGCIAARKS